MAEVTVVIPMYNAVEYIGVCLESILAQSYKNIEVIVINDGSTDKSIDICEEYMHRDARIKLINKNNGGVSSARNLGIKEASGEYLVFVDADDTIDKDLIYKLYRDITYNKADLSFCKIDFLKRKSMSDVEFKIDPDTKQTYSRFIKSLITNDIVATPCAKIFSKKIILCNSILFPEDIKIGEDYIFVMRYLLHSSTASFIDEILYFYRYAENSAMNKYEPEKFYCYKRINKEKRNLMSALEITDRFSLQEADIFTLDKFVGCIKAEMSNKSPYRLNQRYQRIKDIVNDEDFEMVLEKENIGGLPITHKIIAYMLYYIPFNYLMLPPIFLLNFISRLKSYN